MQLPAHIDTSARAWYNLADRWDREMLYRILNLEAWRDEEFAVWLNRDGLVDLWPEIHLPRPVRAKWEAADPVLAARADRAVPQP